MYSLEKKFRNKWIKALRSGKYKQGKLLLVRDSMDSETKRKVFQYCCLGVACKIAGVSIDKLEFKHSFIPPKDIYCSSDRELFTNVPKELKGSEHSSLPWTFSNMNDSGKSFLQIADWIEQNVEVR